MYFHICLTISVRGIPFSPTTAAKFALGASGFMNAADGLRADFFFAQRKNVHRFVG